MPTLAFGAAAGLFLCRLARDLLSIWAGSQQQRMPHQAVSAPLIRRIDSCTLRTNAAQQLPFRQLVTTLLVSLSLLFTGCYGPFHMTQELHERNADFENKWVNEGVFLLLLWVPIYAFAVLSDAIVINAITFWSEEDPFARYDGPQTRHVARGHAEAYITFVPTPAREELIVEQFRRGQPQNLLRIRHENGLTVATNEQGETLFVAETLADGTIVVKNRDGSRVASYPPGRVRRVMEIVRR